MALWEKRDLKARDVLIEHNLRLVAHIVKKFENTREDRDDLLSIGAFGLIKAVDTYNFKSNTKLATYAARCIENEILMHLRSNKKRKDTSSLFAPIGEDREGNEIHLSDIVEDPSPLASEILITEEQNVRIKEALKILTERELEIISRRFGLNNHFIETQREIAKSLKSVQLCFADRKTGAHQTLFVFEGQTKKTIGLLTSFSMIIGITKG